MTVPVRAGALAGLMLAASALAAAPRAAVAQPSAPGADRAFEATTLNLAAFGETEVAPDQAILTLGVQSRAASAAAAMAQNASRMTAVVAALRKAGIGDRDIRTTNVNLSPQYSYPPGRLAVLEDYAAGNDVTVTVSDIARLGAVVDAVTAAGANQINGISFGLKEPGAAEDAARLAAVKALAAKAALYAGASGYHVARLIRLSEEAGGAQGPVRPLAMTAAKLSPTPISAGELTVRIDVTGVYELAK